MTHDRKAINTLVAQPAASAEPSDMAHEIWAAAQLAPGEGIVDGAARVEALLSRYGRPAGDAQPVADHKFYPHPGYRAFCQKCGKAEADHPTAPVAAQKADDARDAERLNWLETKVVNVRIPLLHGSHDLFWASPQCDDVSEPYGPSDIRAKIDAARVQERKGE